MLLTLCTAEAAVGFGIPLKKKKTAGTHRHIVVRVESQAPLMNAARGPSARAGFPRIHRLQATLRLHAF